MCDACASDVPVRRVIYARVCGEGVELCSSECLARLERVRAPARRRPRSRELLLASVALACGVSGLAVSVLFALAR
jgi:hypothetical protein